MIIQREYRINICEVLGPIYKDEIIPMFGAHVAMGEIMTSKVNIVTISKRLI